MKTDLLGLFPPGSVPGFRLVPNAESEQSISETTPMANLAYKWTDGFMTYASYSEGFKSGGFTQRIFPPLPAPPPFGPEFAKSYELGFKFDSADHRLRLNGAASSTDYTDLQVQVLVGVQPLTANAGGAEVKGFELELQTVPIENLQINAGVGYTDAEYTSLDSTVLATGVTLDSKFAQVPEWTGNLDVDYTIDAGVGPDHTAGRFQLSLGGVHECCQHGVAAAEVHAGGRFDRLRDSDGRWRFTVSGRT